MSKNELQAAAELLSSADAVTALTGAGVSAESGVPTFRGVDGLWRGHSITEVASPKGFTENPQKVWEFYNERRQALINIKPNAAHYALAELASRSYGFGLITQNVDRLHQQAGSPGVVELHGNIWEVRCCTCATVFDRTGQDLGRDPLCEQCGGRLRPAVVWFGEALPEDSLEKAYELSRKCSVFLLIGTAAVVYPAAGLMHIARQAGAKVIEINIEHSAASADVDIFLQGRAGELLPKLLALGS